jgi:transitional endoplasmic reticulum ATPase
MTVSVRFVAAPESARGLVRLSPEAMAAQGLSPGDTVSLTAARRTHVRVMPADVPEGEIHADGRVAENAGVGPSGEVALAPVRLPGLSALSMRTSDRTTAEPQDLLDALFDMAVTVGDRLRVPVPGGPAIEAEVRAASPVEAGRVTDATTVTLELPPGAGAYDGVGGLAREVARVHEVVAAPLQRPDLFARLGIAAPRGLLFTGPPGSGKTLLARAVATATRATFFQIAGPEIVSKHYGESEAALRRIFSAAAREAPAIIFIDEIDAIAPRRDDMTGDRQVERRGVAQLLTLMDGLSDRGQVVVMAATNQPDAIDPALRRPGRFDREIAFAPPGVAERRQILDIHLAAAPLARDVDLDRIASAAHGYVGADLAALAREAAVAALSRAIAGSGGEQHVDAARLFIEQVDLEHGLAVTGPSALRGAGGVAAPLRMSDIGGLDEVKARLRQSIAWPRTSADVVARYRIEPVRGILLVGPPGSGKTMMARALAFEAGMNFVAVRPTDLLARHFGAAERALARLFAKARASAPAILFFDEFDAIAPGRGARDAVLDRIVAQFLVELDGVTGGDGVVMLGATNRASAIDPALLRPGRFDEIIEIPMPDREARRAILAVHLEGRPTCPDLDADAFAGSAKGATGADLAEMVAAAARDAAGREIATGRPDTIARADLDRHLSRWRVQRALRDSDFLRPGEPAE